MGQHGGGGGNNIRSQLDLDIVFFKREKCVVGPYGRKLDDLVERPVQSRRLQVIEKVAVHGFSKTIIIIWGGRG